MMKMKLMGATFRLLNLSLFVFLLVCFASCNNEDFISKNFNDYLSLQEVEIVESPHYYVVFSRYACQTCFNSLLPIFLEAINHKNTNNFSFIIANQKDYPLLNQLDYHIIHDDAGEIDRMNINISDFAIIKTNHKIIVDSWNFSLAQNEEFLSFLKLEFKY